MPSAASGWKECFHGAFEILLQDRENVRLIIAGDGVLRQPLEKRAVDNGCIDRVLFTGPLGDKVLGAMYRAVDLVVMPSRYEPFGMVALEAAACGARVLTSDTGGLSELAGHWPAAIATVKAGDPAQLAERMSVELNAASKSTAQVPDEIWWPDVAACIQEAITDAFRKELGQSRILVRR